MLLEFMSFYPEEGGDKIEDLDEGTSAAGKDDDKTVDTGSDDEESRRKAHEGFLSRDRKRAKKMDLLEERINSISTKLSEFVDSFSSQMEAAKKEKGGRPKGDETKSNEAVELLMGKLDKISDSVSSRMDAFEERLEKEKSANIRREILVNAGASPDFLSMVEQGIINVPENALLNYDDTTAFVTRLGGLAAPNGKATATSATDTDKTRTASVPHRDGDADTGAVHADQKTKLGVDETLATIDKELDDIFDKQKGPPDVKTVQSLIELAEKADELTG